MWFIVSGQGIVAANAVTEAVGAGDIVRLQPLTPHMIANRSDDELLIFLTIWWEDYHALKAAENGAGRAAEEATTGYLLLPAFPTPNGKLHVGHLGGPYVAADVLRRALHLMGIPAFTLLGTLGHMNHVAVAAERRGESYYQTAEHYTRSIKDTLAAFQIGWDAFVGPEPSEAYKVLTREIFRVLFERGVIVAKKRNVHRRPSDGRLLFEAQVRGECPFCGADASANDCESCGRFHDDGQTIGGCCARTGEALEFVEIERLYFQLERVRDALREFRSRSAMPVEVRSYVDDMLSRELPEVGISHYADYGVSLPIEGYEQQRLNSYFEHAGRLFIAIQHLPGVGANWREWIAARQLKLVPIFGVDNCFMRSILFPALLAAYSGSLIMPDILLMNYFCLLDREKFSTSRGHAIWGDQFSAERQVDAIRFHLAATRPETSASNFTLAQFDESVNAVRVGRWQQWLARIQERLKCEFDDTVPEAGPWTAEAHRFYKDLVESCARIRDVYLPETFSTVRACIELNRLVELANRFGEETTCRPQGVSAREADTHMALELMAARTIAVLAWPIMPTLGEGVLAALGEQSGSSEWTWPDPPVFVRRLTRIESLAQDWFKGGRI
jgi:methionyl-tRNA synthetase